MSTRVWLERYGDVALAVVLAVLFTVEVIRWESADPAVAVPAALVATLALSMRRKAPLIAFLLSFAGSWTVLRAAPSLDNDSAGFIIVFFVSLFSLGRHSRGHEVWMGGLCVVGYILVFLLGDPAADATDPGHIGFATLFVGTPWAAGLALRLRQDREQALSAHNAELQRDQEARARQAVAAERARIARELHDVVSHAIAVTVLQARGGRRMLGVDEAQVRRSLDAIEHTNTQALSDMRRLLSLLRDAEDGPPAGPQPSLERLDALLEEVRGSGLPVQLTVTGSSSDVPPGVDLSAYRIIQEALTNILKHAGPGASAHVEVALGGDAVDLAVIDDGQVAVEGDGSGQGLIGIRERVAVVGGQVEAGPRPDGGFAVRARLPYTVDA